MEDLKENYLNLERSFKDKIEGIIVQKMIKEGYELILGSKRDEKFGPIILFGLGGIYVEVLKDITFRLAHIREFSAYRMPCLVILKFRLFLIFPTHPQIKPSALKNPIF
jgi:Acyl-CoA synthetase (NDP forming)